MGNLRNRRSWDRVEKAIAAIGAVIFPIVGGVPGARFGWYVSRKSGWPEQMASASLFAVGFALLALFVGMLLLGLLVLAVQSLIRSGRFLRHQTRQSVREFLSSRWKRYACNIGVTLLVFIAVFFGVPGWNTWRADNASRATCSDLQQVQQNLPDPFQFGTDYTNAADYPKLSAAIGNALSHAIGAMNADKKHYTYLMNEVYLLDLNLEGLAQDSDLHSPSNLLDLNLVPFCEPSSFVKYG